MKTHTAKKELIEELKILFENGVLEEKEVIKVLDKYDIDKVPKHHCSECLNFKQVKPKEVFHTGPFYDPGHCTRGHIVDKHAADHCPHFFSGATQFDDFS